MPDVKSNAVLISAKALATRCALFGIDCKPEADRKAKKAFREIFEADITYR